MTGYVLFGEGTGNLLTVATELVSGVSVLFVGPVVATPVEVVLCTTDVTLTAALVIEVGVPLAVLFCAGVVELTGTVPLKRGESPPVVPFDVDGAPPAQ